MQYLFGIINKISPVSSIAVVAQWVGRSATDHRLVKLVSSNPPGDVFQISFSNCFYLSFMLGQVKVSDIAILCNRPNNCCQQNLKCFFDEPLFSLGLFSWKSNNKSVNCPACLICSSKFNLP